MNALQYVKTTIALAETLMKRFFRDKTALFFSLVFPLLFLVVFGSIFGNVGSISFDVGLMNNSQTEFASQFVDTLESSDVFNVSEIDDFETAKEEVGRGELDAIIELPESFGAVNTSGLPNGEVITYLDESEQQGAQTFNSVIESVVDEINAAVVETPQPFSVRQASIQTANLSQFDYLFSGLLGFTILSIGIFQMANGFPADKKAGILRRLKATPLRSSQLLIGTSLHYMVVGLLSLFLMIIVGIMLFEFQMQGNWLTFAIFALISMLMMYGFGLAIGGWAQNENQSQPISNVLAFPMMFLSGVFFPRFIMPEFLQSIAQYIPLSPIVDGFRLIITENYSLLELGPQLAVIAVWAVLIYTVASYTFRWE